MSSLRKQLLRLAAPVVAGLCLVSITACGSDGSDAAGSEASSATEIPNLVGTWSGSYGFPYDGKVIETSLDLVIERQEGVNLFGYESFVDREGKTIRFDLAGTVNIDPIDGEVEAVLVTTGFFFDIEVVSEDRLSVRFVRTDDKPTTFVVELTKKA